jgi:hypothetical protein
VHHNHVLMIIQLILIFCTTDCNCIGIWNSGKKASMTASSSSTSSQQQQQQQQTNSKNEDDDGGGGGGGENNNNIDNNNNNNSKKTTVSSTPGSGSTSTIEDHDDDDVDVDVDMNKTYLDLFGESAKEFLTKKRNIKIIKKINKNIINPENNTLDQNCKWDWKYIRCEPFCECSFQYKLPNDLFYPHLGRACRNRKNQQQVNENENENETKKESKDEILYRTYCSNDNDSDSSNDDNKDTDKSRRVPPPPPPSIQIHIPSPIPIVTRYVKSIWRIIRNKSDIVMNHANNEFEIVHGKLQNIVCQDLKTRCDSDSDSDDNNGNKQNSSSSSYSPIITMVAWQERLLCQEIIRECVVVVVDGEE